jgi:hypothetical protein
MSFTFQERYHTSNAQLICHCLSVVGAYVTWIEIGLIANDQFMPMVIHQLLKLDTREAAADCICKVVNKGMEPVAKAKFVESMSSILISAGILKPIQVIITKTFFSPKTNVLCL